MMIYKIIIIDHRQIRIKEDQSRRIIRCNLELVIIIIGVEVDFHQNVNKINEIYREYICRD